ncbi:MAG: peptide chain release factor N(5)-glutamine methyltransferase, partial [Syntrophaceae bacterium]|nr:peptide chain release factor N(5)-glutamine methyltransferase [Syntrophaceae bacterium]
MTWTVLKLIQWTEEYFKKHNVPNPRLDAELLLSHLLKKKRIDLYLQFDAPLNQSELASFKELVKRRIAREPLQHITQTQEFWSLPIKVTPDVLIPRQETEHIIEHALKLFNKDSLIQILDIGTGSGAIAAALASEFQNAKITATDISEKALVVAKENLLQFGDQIILKKTNLFDDI